MSDSDFKSRRSFFSSVLTCSGLKETLEFLVNLDRIHKIDIESYIDRDKKILFNVTYSFKN